MDNKYLQTVEMVCSHQPHRASAMSNESHEVDIQVLTQCIVIENVHLSMC